jgi:hypothetical protein
MTMSWSRSTQPGSILLDSKIRDGEFKLILPYRPPFILGTTWRARGRRRIEGPALQAGRRGLCPAARWPHRDVRGIHRRERSRPGAEAQEPHHGGSGFHPPGGADGLAGAGRASRLRKGQKVLIHAGSGGVGTFAIQLAKHLGATVATTTSTANAELVKSLGADVVIDYKKQDFEKVLSGYDVVLNSLDGDTLRKSLKVLKPGGKLISISGPPDPDFARNTG